MDHGVPKWRKKGDMVRLQLVLIQFRVRVFQHYYSFLEEIERKYKTDYYLRKKAHVQRLLTSNE